MRVLTILNFIAVLLLIVEVGLYIKIRKTREEMMATAKEQKRADDQDQTQIARLQDEIRLLDGVLTPQSPSKAAPVAQKKNVSPEKSTLAQRFKDPTAYEAFRAEKRLEIAKAYKALFKRLQLSKTDRETLLDCATDIEMAMTETRLTSEGRHMTEAQRSEIAAVVASDSSEKIKNLLGADKYATWEDFQKTTVQRARVDSLANAMNANGVAVDDRAADKLVTLYTEVYGTSYLNRFDDSRASSRAYQRRVAELDQAFAGKAAEVLGTGTSKIVKTYLQLQQPKAASRD